MLVLNGKKQGNDSEALADMAQNIADVAANGFIDVTKTITTGFFYNSAGVKTANANYNVTEPIDCTQGDVFAYRASLTGSSAYRYVLFNAAGGVISANIAGAGLEAPLTVIVTITNPLVKKIAFTYFNAFPLIFLKKQISIPYRALKNPMLVGKKIAVLGDSLSSDETVDKDHVWLGLICANNYALYHNYAISGNSISVDTDCMAVRYTDMDDDLDYVIVQGGANDNNDSAPIGTSTDATIETYKGALNILVAGLITKYPTAKILFLTNYNRGLSEVAYVDAMIEMCAKYSIKCLDMYRESGICFSNAEHISALTNGTNHLSSAGHAFISSKIEAVLATL